jgi:outer membrane protein OmpA-like peptidoglycan-associated protein
MHCFKRKTLITSCAAVALLQCAWTLQAENVHLGTESASSEEIIEMLMPSPGKAKTRGLRFKEESVPEESEPPSISLEVYFALDSAQLTPEALTQLAPVGEALRSEELEGLEFGLAGYTDASGEASYNLTLSEQRAKAVRDYFVNESGIDAERLTPVGRGETDLLDPESPNSGMNRRVKITTK